MDIEDLVAKEGRRKARKMFFFSNKRFCYNKGLPFHFSDFCIENAQIHKFYIGQFENLNKILADPIMVNSLKETNT